MVRRLHELESDQARQIAMQQWPEPSPPSARAPRPRSEREQLLAEIATLMRVGVRLEVRLLGLPLVAQELEVTREALGQLEPLLEALTKAISRALMHKDNSDETLANP